MKSDNIVADKTLQKFIIASAAFAGFMSLLDTYIVNISLPTIARYFNIGTSQISKVTLAYLLILTSTLLIFGRLGDKWGIKKVFVLGYSLFTIGSFFCGISSNLNMLVVSRSIQGIGGAMLYASSPAIIPRFIPKEIRGWAYGLISTAAALGITLGAPLGGFITEYFSWNWVFLINVPIGTIAVIAAIKIIPEEKQEVSKEIKDETYDVFGGVLSFAGLFFLLFVLNRGSKYGWNSPIILISSIAFIIFVVSFIYWEKRYKFPLLDLRFFRSRNINFSVISCLFGSMLLAGSSFLLPFYLISVKGLKSDKAGLVFLVYSVVYMILCPSMGRLSDKFSTKLLSSIGMFFASVACIFFYFTLKFSGISWVIIFLILQAISYSFFISPITNMIMSLFPRNKEGIASGIFKTTTNLGMALGLCLFETFYSLGVNGEKTIANIKKLGGQLYKGFEYAYLFGAIVCFIAFIFLLMINIKSVITRKL